MTGWDTRAEIGLKPPRAISTNINPTKGVAFHYGGGGPYKRASHADCRAVWRAYQAWHMAPGNTNNYTDIAYNMGVCHHDVILEGRSTRTRPKVRGGANGDAVVNGNRYSICAIWGLHDGAPTDGLKRAYLTARQFLRDKGGAGNGTVGHRDMAGTSCPGNSIYAWIQAGCPAPAPIPTPTPTPIPTPIPQPTGAAAMILVRQDMGNQPDRVWLIDGQHKRHVANLATFETLKAHIPYQADPAFTSQLLQSFVSLDPISNLPPEPVPAPPPTT